MPWIPNEQHAARGRPLRHARRGPGVPPLSDAELPERSRHHLEDVDRAGNAGAGAGQALVPRGAHCQARRTRAAEFNKKRKEGLAKASATPTGDKITFAYLSRLVGEAVGDDAVIFNEYSLIQEQISREKPDTFYGLSAAGGLGWGFGAALGAKLAAPEKFVVATLGDGAYMFANPMVAHWVSDVHKLPILTIVFNNSLYGAVRGATMSMFKDGVAGEDGGRFMADLSPSPAFEAAVKAQGGHGERVEKAVRTAGGARPRHRRGDQGEAPGAAQRDLPAVAASLAHRSRSAGRGRRGVERADSRGPRATQFPRQIANRRLKQTPTLGRITT